MINLRYHIVSITAVFLALGIGLTLGTSFLDRVTVDTLKQQLDEVEGRVEATDAENSALSDEVARLRERDSGLVDGLDRLVDGELTDVPVLVLATEGTDGDHLSRLVDLLGASGAEVAGTWWFTDRWTLDDDDEVQALAEVLEIDTADADRLLRAAGARLGQVLSEAGQPVEAGGDESTDTADPSDGGVTGEGATDEGATEAPGTGEPTDEEGEVVGEGPVEPTVPAEPDLVMALEAAGFIDYQALPDDLDERVLLAPEGVRYLFVSDLPAGTGAGRPLLPLLEEMTAEGVAPVVAAQGDTDLRDDEGDPAPEDDRRTTFVGALRESDDLRGLLTTLDDIDTAAGLVAAILAIDDLENGRVGHYGVGPGADGLVPGSPDP
ncbi:MAG: copper transporter [Acidimicrobiales bacterium]